MSSNELTVVAAQPGYEVLALGPDMQFRKYEVVAWAVSVGGGAIPVCVGFRCTENDLVLRCPDGSIRFVGKRRFKQDQASEALQFAIQLRETTVLQITPDGISWVREE